MRGSLRMNFQLNSIHQFRQCTFRFQFFNILSSSDIAHIPNICFPMNVVYNGENCFSISFFFFENYGSKHQGTFKKSSNFEKRERKYAITWGGGGRERGQKSIKKHFYCIPFVFITICIHSAFTFMRF